MVGISVADAALCTSKAREKGLLIVPAGHNTTDSSPLIGETELKESVQIPIPSSRTRNLTALDTMKHFIHLTDFSIDAIQSTLTKSLELKLKRAQTEQHSKANLGAYHK